MDEASPIIFLLICIESHINAKSHINARLHINANFIVHKIFTSVKKILLCFSRNNMIY